MQYWLRNIIANVGACVPLHLLRQNSKLPPFLPFYHLVSDRRPDYVNSYVVRSVQMFEKELDYLLSRYEAVDLKDIVENPTPQKMHLSFDDGLLECATIIAPILRRKGIPATFFVSPDFVDNKVIFHRFKRSILETKEILEKTGKKYFQHETHLLDELAVSNHIVFSDYNPYMSLFQLKELVGDGFTLGAHSMNHPEMDLLTEEEQYWQIKESMQWISENFKPAIRAFAFPFSDDGVKLSLFQKLLKENIVDVTFGTAGLKFDMAQNHYQRIPIEYSYNWSIKKVVHFEYFYYFVRALFHKNVVTR